MKFSVAAITFQVFMIILFAVLSDYDPKQSGPEKKGNQTTESPNGDQINLYRMFQDVHVMIFLGFGFLMTFLKKYGFGSVGYTFFTAALAIQWYLIIRGCIDSRNESLKIELSLKSLVQADFSAAAVLISFGVVLGTVSRLQILIILIIEIGMYALNEYILLEKLQIADAGGSLVIHCFGCYFGMALSLVLRWPEDTDEHPKEKSVYHSDLFAMIGTVFLWLFWPSFNSILVKGDADQQRTIINTYLSLVGCCVTTFAISELLNKKRKLSMVHVQNATLAGGVAIGTMANMVIKPWGALLIGSLAGIISTLGYRYVSPFLNDKLRLHDTCGVHNLHGMPALLAGIGGAVAAKLADASNYYDSLPLVFPAADRSPTKQGGYQAVAILVTLGLSLVSGAITGFIVKCSIFDPPTRSQMFDDGDYWELPGSSTVHDPKASAVQSSDVQ